MQNGVIHLEYNELTQQIFSDMRERMIDINQTIADPEPETDGERQSDDGFMLRMDGIDLLMDAMQLNTGDLQQSFGYMPDQFEAMQQNMYENFQEIEKGAPESGDVQEEQAAPPNSLIDWMDTMQYISDISLNEEDAIE